MILADTNVLMAVLRGDTAARGLLQDHLHETLVPTFSAWELWRGATSATRTSAVEALLQDLPLDPFVGAMARTAGLLQVEHERSGTQRPVLDLLIASHAIYHGAKVATLDRDYEGIKGVRVLRP